MELVSRSNVGQICYLRKLKANFPYVGPEINGTQEVSNLMGKMILRFVMKVSFAQF